jgi:hypothetical protein
VLSQAATLATLTAWFTCGPPPPLDLGLAAGTTTTAPPPHHQQQGGDGAGAGAGSGAAPGLRLGPGAVWLLSRTTLLTPLTLTDSLQV